MKSIKNKMNLVIGIGAIVSLGVKPEVGSQAIEVSAISEDGKTVTGHFGRYENDEFYRRTFTNKNDKNDKRRTIEVAPDEIAAVLKDAPKTKGSKQTMKEDVKETPEKTTPATGGEQAAGETAKPAAQEQPKSDDAAAGETGGDKGEGANPHFSGDELTNNNPSADTKTGAKSTRDSAKSKKEKEKEKLKKQKEATKEKEAQKKRTDELTEKTKEAGLKVADVAAKHGKAADGTAAKNFSKFTVEEHKAAMDDLKAVIKTKKDNETALAKITLSADEEKERARIETHVRKFIGQIKSAYFEIGVSAAIARQKKLYRSTHQTFEAYAIDVFGLSKPQLNSIMRATETFEAIKGNLKLNFDDLPSIRAAERIAQGVAGLLKAANLEDSPEKTELAKRVARNIYDTAIANSPVRNGKATLTPDVLDATISTFEAGKVKIGDKETVLNVAATSTATMFDKDADAKKAAAALKQTVTDSVAALKANKGTKGSKLSDALNNVGETPKIPAGVKPKCTLVCEVHGKVTMDKTTDTNYELSCGCVHIATTDGYAFSHNTKETPQTPPPAGDAKDGEGDGK